MTTERTTRTVGEGEDLITYDVHGALEDATPERPALVLLGSPMEAEAFLPLAAQLDDRPVVTVDPRGAGRNPAATGPLEPAQHAQDLHRVVEALEAGPVDVFASSGGAVNALTHVTAFPEDVRRLVAHEPPTTALLPDREVLEAACRRLAEVYATSGSGPAMAGFLGLVMEQGELDPAWLETPLPDPGQLGKPTHDDGSRTDPLFRNLPACNLQEPDVVALRELGDRVVLGVGEESGATFAARGARSIAAALGQEAAVFPGDHTGFAGELHGMPAGKPAEFAVVLRAVLDR